MFDRHHRRTEHEREQEQRTLRGLWYDAPVGPPQQRTEQDGAEHRDADEREAVGELDVPQVDVDIGPDGRGQDEADDADPHPVDTHARLDVGGDRLVAMLLQRGRYAEHHQRDDRGDIGMDDVERIDAVDPHHGGRGVAHHAAGTACVRRSHDRGKVADVHTPLEHAGSDGTADDRGGDVVEETGQHEDQHQQHECALPVIRQVFRQDHWHMALFEMPGKQGKAGEQAEQVGDNDPFVAEMANQAGNPGAGLETGEHDLVQADCCQAGQCHVQRVVVEEGNA